MCAERRLLSIAAGETSLSFAWKKGGRILFENSAEPRNVSAAIGVSEMAGCILVLKVES